MVGVCVAIEYMNTSVTDEVFACMCECAQSNFKITLGRAEKLTEMQLVLVQYATLSTAFPKYLDFELRGPITCSYNYANLVR